MNTAFLEEMTGVLEQELVKLKEELVNLAPNGKKGNAFDADYDNLGDKEDESAEKVAGMGDAYSLESELTTALRDVESALAAIKGGTYGVCKYCKTEIAEERLRARPTSTSCVACKKTLTQEL
ncbi:MAG: C4-type zinc finger protein, DksA/TraR family [Candidatus Uhrbacteria bacterium GW2011_GWD2_52_7]|uniref:C4-type zinc finger protein, DksA/TraR family n=1 Tax=Candidatus Uhrbacteria bacterium GW2011_GWD2_52_7 TaxID=1618989 RepID=A0A0G1XDF3_9BACT|nr:MAG: C4-type zinc finger protein, DksA/TraR family [Candidatus Uhrbacteria bacterium GW2011_GWD2_52_7]